MIFELSLHSWLCLSLYLQLYSCLQLIENWNDLFTNHDGWSFYICKRASKFKNVKKEKKSFLIYCIRKFRRDRVRSHICMTKGLLNLINDLCISSYNRKPFLIHIWLCFWSLLNFLIYEDNFHFFFNSGIGYFVLSPLTSQQNPLKAQTRKQYLSCCFSACPQRQSGPIRPHVTFYNPPISDFVLNSISSIFFNTVHFLSNLHGEVKKILFAVNEGKGMSNMRDWECVKGGRDFYFSLCSSFLSHLDFPFLLILSVCLSHTVISLWWVSAKFGTCTVVSVNETIHPGFYAFYLQQVFHLHSRRCKCQI